MLRKLRNPEPVVRSGMLLILPRTPYSPYGGQLASLGPAGTNEPCAMWKVQTSVTNMGGPREAVIVITNCSIFAAWRAELPALRSKGYGVGVGLLYTKYEVTEYGVGRIILRTRAYDSKPLTMVVVLIVCTLYKLTG